MPDDNDYGARGAGLRSRLDRQFQDLRTRADDMIPLWQDAADFTLPWRIRAFDAETENRGSRGNPMIVDTTPTRALKVFTAGMLSALANPASVWFELAPVRPELGEIEAVQIWNQRTRDIMLAIFDRSNTYSAFAGYWRDQGAFANACGILLPDLDDEIRCELFPIGSFFLGIDERKRVDTMVRSTTLTVSQVVSEFGLDAVSPTTRNAWESQQFQKPVVVRHGIFPNAQHVGGRLGFRGWRWVDAYWEQTSGTGSPGDDPTWGASLADGPGGGVLRVGGWKTFPIIAPRWDRNDEEVYSVSGPAIDCLGDNMELQASRRAYSNARAKIVDPPVVGGPGIEKRHVSMMAGGKTVDPDMAGGGTGVRDLHREKPDLREFREDMQDLREAVLDSFNVRAFLSILNDQRSQPRTAEEIVERRREKAMLVGPVAMRQEDELLDPYINRTLEILIAQSEPYWARGQDGILPIPPDELVDEPLRVRYVSEAAQSQRLAALSGIDRYFQWIAGVSQLFPDVLDNVNVDEAHAEVAKAAGVPPVITRPPEEVESQRQQRRAEQIRLMRMEQMPDLARAAKDLSQTKTDGDTALDAVMEQAAVS